MTIGQRIALKRKERSLSQEALGQEVGVSRQSIYKWESDAAVPEIDKLIALSRLFGVSVGWLLGVEEPPEADGAGETASPSSAPEELTEAQLKMVEQIVERYTAALPKPPSPRRRRWNQFGIAAGVLCLGAVLVSLFSRLDGLDQQYNDLQNGLAQVESSVNSQMGSATGRIEDILKAQSNLTADYSVELVPTASSAKENQVEFSVHAVLKSYTEGTEVKFSVDNDTGAVIYTPGVAAPDGGFTGTLSCQLTDSIAVSAVLINPDGTRSTQLLERFEGLYSSTMPEVQIYGGEQLLWQQPDGSGRFTLPELILSTWPGSTASAVDAPLGQSEISSVQLGLFLNRCLLTWLEPCDPPEDETSANARYFRLSEGTTLTMAEETDQLVFAAVVTDQYGRQAVYSDIPFVLSGGELGWVSVSDTSDHNVTNWSFDPYKKASP